VSDRVLDYTQRFYLGVPIFYIFSMGWGRGASGGGSDDGRSTKWGL